MLLLDFLQSLALAGVTALMAVVYREILLREPVLSWWRKIGDRYESKWWHAPIWGCHKCIAGQLALWTYLYNHISINHTFNLVYGYLSGFKLLRHYYTFSIQIDPINTYSLISHIFTICAAILFSDLLKTKLNQWI